MNDISVYGRRPQAILSRFAHLLALSGALGTALSAAGCNCGGRTDTDTGTDAAVGTDAVTPGTDAASDGGEAGPIPIGDAATLDYVMDQFIVPAAADMVGFDLTGDGIVDNQLAEILEGVEALAGPVFDAQGSIDMALADGSLLYLLALDGVKNAVDDPAIAVSEVFGEDTDADPTNNFLGGAMLSVAPGQTPAVLLGPVTAGTILAGPTDLPLMLPVGTVVIASTLTGAMLQADIDLGGGRLNNGILGGALTEEALQMDLYPAIADLVNNELALVAALVPGGPVPCIADTAGDRASMDCGAGEECTAANAIDMGACIVPDAFTDFWLNVNFDANEDGVLTGTEIGSSPVIAVIVVPDVDTDGDGEADAVSFAVQFTAVDCVIIP